jgi:hypothetical protein
LDEDVEVFGFPSQTFPCWFFEHSAGLWEHHSAQQPIAQVSLKSCAPSNNLLQENVVFSALTGSCSPRKMKHKPKIPLSIEAGKGNFTPMDQMMFSLVLLIAAASHKTETIAGRKPHARQLDHSPCRHPGAMSFSIVLVFCLGSSFCKTCSSSIQLIAELTGTGCRNRGCEFFESSVRK